MAAWLMFPHPARAQEAGSRTEEQAREQLIDFNATLGSAGIGLRERRDGYEYLAEPSQAWKALPALGLRPRPRGS